MHDINKSINERVDITVEQHIVYGSVAPTRIYEWGGTYRAGKNFLTVPPQNCTVPPQSEGAQRL
jgi:hypothetical protein